MLEVLTPVAINSGEKLSPLSDYFVEEKEKRLYFVNEEKLFQKLTNDSALLEKYSGGIQNTKIDSADRFLNNLLGDVAVQDIAKDHPPIPFHGENTTELSTIVKSNNQPYIPGSSLKGAIKNAFLYHWLTNTEEGKQELVKFIENNGGQIKNKALKISKWSIEINRLKEEKKRLKKDFPKDELDKLKRLSKSVNKEKYNCEKIFSAFEKDIHTKAFAVPNPKEVLKQPSGNLSVSDSSIRKMADVEVGDLKRKSLNNKEWTLNLQEFLKKGTTFRTTITFSISELSWEGLSKDSAFGKLIHNPSNLLGIFKALNAFYRDTRQLYQVFGLKIPNVTPKLNEAVIFLGGGKGVYRNTILLAIKKYYEANSWDFKKDFIPVIYEYAAQNDTFPVSCSHINKEPLGFVKLVDPNHEAYQENLDTSYTEKSLKSGDPVEAIFIAQGKPSAKVEILVNNQKQQVEVVGYKKYLKFSKAPEMTKGQKCTIYWNNGQFNFNKP